MVTCFPLDDRITLTESGWLAAEGHAFRATTFARTDDDELARSVLALVSDEWSLDLDPSATQEAGPHVRRPMHQVDLLLLENHCAAAMLTGTQFHLG